MGYPLLGGVVRTHHSPASTCRLNPIQNAAAKLSWKLSSPDARNRPIQMRIVPTAIPVGEGTDHPASVVDDIAAADCKDGEQ